jgi:hypothetical protein
MTKVNNVIGVVNYVIAARPSLLNYMIADIATQIARMVASRDFIPGFLADGPQARSLLASNWC